MTNQVNILPMIALRGTTVLPDMIVHFDVSREKSIRAVEAAMLHDQKIFLLTQKDPEVEIPELTDLYQVGTVAYIKQVVKLPQDLYRVLVEGLDRAEVLLLYQFVSLVQGHHYPKHIFFFFQLLLKRNKRLVPCLK